MPRLLGVDIPGSRKLPYALRYIYGIGPARADAIVASLGLDPDRRANDLTEEDLTKITAEINEKQFAIEGDLRRDIASNLKRLQAINCYRGMRHRRGLPVRGQKTQCNARTRKGKPKTVGIIKKATI
ncbi:MAG: 30S ribosomal protein S13 [Candidatus Moanabacter tarae]|uniref:Small ribosomal subunit protein uS13 n=1 Tax=Candidatus Moanibacter tarae TaxID=2200854 RepID=A0A2Z4ABV4_9BACT|nr:MAG: 30S ribosomal protein S13 [Candidatus Moanabacter tarae]|tara:strand:+ start:16455 stop:16835 length:381 start_codon:yes stop_codon:yes gene_type:complete